MRAARLGVVTFFLLPVAAAALTGDCNDDGLVDLSELIRGVAIALDTRPLVDCDAFDRNGDDSIDVSELVAAVAAALQPSTVTPQATTTATSLGTATPSATGSVVPSATDTPSPSPSQSPTVTAGSPAPTGTATETTSITPATATASPTPVATESESPTETPTPEVTGTASATGAPTSTTTAGASPTSTETSVPGATATPSLAPSATPTVAATSTRTATTSPIEGSTSTPTATRTATPAQIAALDFAVAAVNGAPCSVAAIPFRLLANVAVDVRDLRIDFCADAAFFDMSGVSCMAVPAQATIDPVELQLACGLDDPDPRGQVRATVHGSGGGALTPNQVFMVCQVPVLPATPSGVYSVQMKLRGTTVGDDVFLDFGQSTITVIDGLPIGQCCGDDSQCDSGFCRGGYLPELNAACCESDCAGGACNDPSGPPGTCLETPGGEFHVNTIEYRSQFRPTVAANDDGFVVAWQGNAIDIFTNATDIFARRFDRFGAPLGSELTVNQVLVGVQQSAGVAFSGSGFVVVWSDPVGILGQRFAESGERIGSEFQVSSFTSGGQYYTSIDSADDGSLVVVWDSLGQDGSSQGVFGQRYDSLGGGVGTEFQVNVYTSGTEQAPTVDVASDGSFIVVWEGVGRGAIGQRFDSLGARVGSEFVADDLAAGAAGGPFPPSVAILAGGDFVVTGANLDATYSTGVFARRFSSSATSLGASFQVNTFTYYAQRAAMVAAGEAGGFVVVWRGDVEDGYHYGVFGQRFGSSGQRIGGEFQVNSYTLSYEREPAIAAGGGAGFVVVWEGKGGTNYNAILGQRLP